MKKTVTGIAATVIGAIVIWAFTAVAGGVKENRDQKVSYREFKEYQQTHKASVVMQKELERRLATVQMDTLKALIARLENDVKKQKELEKKVAIQEVEIKALKEKLK